MFLINVLIIPICAIIIVYISCAFAYSILSEILGKGAAKLIFLAGFCLVIWIVWSGIAVGFSNANSDYTICLPEHVKPWTQDPNWGKH